MTPPTYRIKSVTDFLQVPPDRRAICLREFAVWCALREASAALLARIEAQFPDEFVWVDDDKHEAAVVIVDGDQRVEIASGRMRGFDA